MHRGQTFESFERKGLAEGKKDFREEKEFGKRESKERGRGVTIGKEYKNHTLSSLSKKHRFAVIASLIFLFVYFIPINFN